MPIDEKVCPSCEGTGFRPFTRDGIRAVVDCECKKVKFLEARLRRAGLPERYQSASFESFDPKSGPSVERAFFLMRKFVENHMLDPSRGVLLTGPCGTGKTHLAIAAGRDLTMKYGAECFFTDIRNLLKTIQGTFSTAVAANESDVLRPVLKSPVVILDELGAARATDWSADVIEHIINTRYNENRCTIITTNLANEGPSMAAKAAQATILGASTRGTYGAMVEKMPTLFGETLGDRIGARMFSRLQEMTQAILVEGQDYRQRGNA